MDMLVTKAQNGDKAAEQELFERLSVRFEYIAKRRVNGEEAKDVVQDACMTVLQKYKSFAVNTGSFEIWAQKILKNKIGNYLQKKKTRKDNVAESISVNGAVNRSEDSPDSLLLDKVLECLRKIIKTNVNYARVLNLAHQGYKTAEICRRLKIKASYYYVILNRSRNLLNKCLKGET